MRTYEQSNIKGTIIAITSFAFTLTVTILFIFISFQKMSSQTKVPRNKSATLYQPRHPSKLRECFLVESVKENDKEENIEKEEKEYSLLLGIFSMDTLFKCLNKMVNGESFEDVISNKHVYTIIKSLKNTKRFDKIIGEKYDDMNPDNCGFRFPIFHSNSYSEWKYSKAKILQVISYFRLDALISTTPKGYHEQHHEKVMYQGLDFIMCYFILSLVHFKLFKNVNEEMSFFTDLSISDTKTSDCLNWIDKRVAGRLPLTPDMHGLKEVLRKIHLRLKDDDAVYLNEVYYQEYLYKEKTKLHTYFHGQLLSKDVESIKFDFIETKLKNLQAKIRERRRKNS